MRPDVSDAEAGVVLAAQAIVDGAALEVDLDAMAADLDAVDLALRRLDDGAYGTCEVCTADLADDVLGADPVARRCPDHPLATTLPGTAPRFEALAAPTDDESTGAADVLTDDVLTDDGAGDDDGPPP